jgi:hypothetical protein
MRNVLQIGAAICAIFAALTFYFALSCGGFIGREFIISGKNAVEMRSRTQFRLYCEAPYPQRGTYNATVSRAFYDAAKTGDSIRSPLTGYLKLMRDGRVVARHFSQEFVIPAVYSSVALLPLVAFLTVGRSPLPRVVPAVLGLIEVVVVGVFLYGILLPCMT